MSLLLRFGFSERSRGAGSKEKNLLHCLCRCTSGDDRQVENFVAPTGLAFPRPAFPTAFAVGYGLSFLRDFMRCRPGVDLFASMSRPPSGGHLLLGGTMPT